MPFLYLTCIFQLQYWVFFFPCCRRIIWDALPVPVLLNNIAKKKIVVNVWISRVHNGCNWWINGSNTLIVSGGKDTITFSDPTLPVIQRSRSPLLAFTDKPQKTEVQGEHLERKEHDESWALISFQIKSNKFSCWDSRRQSFSGHRDWINHPQVKWIDGPSTNSKETTEKWLLNRLHRARDQVLHLKEFSCQITWYC